MFHGSTMHGVEHASASWENRELKSCSRRLSVKETLRMFLRSVISALCILGPLMSVAYGGNINGEATYISFTVPGALGTYPMGINASMEITGYYRASSTVDRGFLREADGTITTFDVGGGVSTEPQGINDVGDITGTYRAQPGQAAQGFLRYADGRTILVPGTPAAFVSVTPAAINDFDEIVVDYFHQGTTASVRSRTGVFTALPPPGPSATAINASGSVVGFSPGPDGFTGFVAHQDGYWASIGPSGASSCGSQTIPEAINAAGVIAGTFTMNYLGNSSCPTSTGGFVMSPDGEFVLFQPPGQMPYFHDLDLPTGVPLHLVSIDAAGDIAGSYMDAGNVWHGFVRNPYGTLTSFDPSESEFTTVTSINDGGAIAGYYQYNPQGTGLTVGFIRVPK
jgi:hypothetical protein